MPNNLEKISAWYGIPSLFAAMLFLTVPAQAAAPVFGPKTYDVTERYGKENRYPETIAAPEGLYLIKIQNGELAAQRPDLLSFSVNGEMLLKEEQYAYRYLVCFVHLKSTNAVELTIRDVKPPALKRPLLTDRNAVVTIMPETFKTSGIVLGVQAWEDVKNYAEALRNIRSPESSALAVNAANLRNDPDARADAMKKLAARKDQDARVFILSRYFDNSENSKVRGEADSHLAPWETRTRFP